MFDQNCDDGNFNRVGEIIDLGALIRTLFHRRLFVIISWLLIVVISTLIIVLTPRGFLGEAFMRVGNFDSMSGGMPISFFKEGEILIRNIDHFKNILTKSRAFNKEEKALLSDYMGNKSLIKNFFSPVANFTRVAQLSSSDGTSIIGFQLHFMGRSPDFTKKVINFFCEYIRTSYLSLALEKYIINKHNEKLQIMKEYEINAAEYDELLERLADKKIKLEEQIRRLPRFNSSDEALLKKMANASVHYLTPQIQLKTVESQMMDIKINAQANRLKLETTQILINYFTEARQLLFEKKNDGIVVLNALEALHDRMHVPKSERSPAIYHAGNEISKNMQRFKNIYQDVFKIVVGPSISITNTISKKIRNVVVVIIGSLLIIIVSILLLSPMRVFQKMK